MQWQFEDYRLDPDNACLWRGEQRLALRPKSFELLRYLVEHAGRLVEKETLMATVWSDAVVVEGVLTTCIGELRKLFGETAKQPRFIATEHRRGYRFIAPVKILDSPAPESPSTTVETSLTYSGTPFIGRRRELRELCRLIVDEPLCRLLTLIGPGGIGKTRLANAVLETLLEDDAAGALFSDGLFFVALQSLHEAGNIPVAMAEAFAYRLYGGKSSREQLLAYLQDKRMLLVLDNFEHLLDGADLIAAVHNAAPGVKLLITSRNALGMHEAWEQHVEGMAYPSGVDAGGSAFAEYDAFKLFEQCARRVGADLSLTAHQQQVLRLCQLVEGMPLALELAAAWLKVLSPEQVAIACGNVDQAVQTIHESIVIHESFGEWNLRFTHLPLAAAYRLRRDYDQAERVARECLEAARTTDHLPDIADSIAQLARLAYDRGDHDRAGQHLAQALELWRQLGNELEIALTSCWVGLVLAQARDTARRCQAWWHFAEALRLALKHGLAPVVLDVCTGVAQLLADDGETADAIELLALAGQHAAASAETRQRARRILDSLPDGVLSDPPTPARDVWRVASELLRLHARLNDETSG